MDDTTSDTIHALASRLWQEVVSGHCTPARQQMLLDHLSIEPFCNSHLDYGATLHTDTASPASLVQSLPTSQLFERALRCNDLSGSARINLARAWKRCLPTIPARADVHYSQAS